MKQRPPAIPSRGERYLKAGLLAAAALLLLAGALSIPFLFESPSIKYKFGLDKTLLRTGKLLGMAATALLLGQLLLGARLKLLDRIFTLPRVWGFHRLNGYIIALLALLHPVFIMWPEDFTLPPLELEYWPQAVGLLLLILICSQVAASRWRPKLGIVFQRWRRIHACVGGIVIFLLVLHILFVSETFADGLPRVALLTATGIGLLIMAAARVRRWREGKVRYVVNAVKAENKDVTTLELETGSKNGFPFLPGQFAFITPTSDHISSEAHPFTISSPPTQTDRLTFTIKNSGDWTSQVKHIRRGDRVSLSGPFGLFSHLICPPQQQLVMIAGGIGITPMLSMLRYMRATGEERRVWLLWSNRTGADRVCRKELESISQDLTGLTMVHTFTAEKIEGAEFGRLDRSRLQALLSDVDRSAAVFLCGPPRMMTQVTRDMRALGFQRRSIHTERFSV
jgi:predicted ferric reductase